MRNNIEKVFYEGSEKLRINPHPKAWSELSERLEHFNKLRKKIRVLNVILATAASVIILVNMMWLVNYLQGSRPSYELLRLEDYRPVRNALAKPVIYQPAAYENQKIVRNELTKMKKLKTPSVNISYLDQMIGNWKLAEEFMFYNAPARLNIFHTSDGHYYLQAGKSNSDAFLLQISNEDGRVKVLHPGVRRIDFVKDSIILYLANGLILEYRRIFDDSVIQ